MYGIDREMPIPQEQGAREAPFNLEGFRAGIAQNNASKAGCNLFWQNFMLDNLVAHTPVKKSKRRS
eukprot:9004984-Alexandrium_andersonii.AAC.1